MQEIPQSLRTRLSEVRLWFRNCLLSLVFVNFAVYYQYLFVFYQIDANLYSVVAGLAWVVQILTLFLFRCMQVLETMYGQVHLIQEGIKI